MPAPPLTVVTAGDFSAANHHNEITRFLQPNAGDTSVGVFDFTWFSGGNGQYQGIWIALAQRRSVPASIGALFGGTPPSGVSGLSIGTTAADGFKLYLNTTTSSAIANIGIAGVYTVFY